LRFITLTIRFRKENRVRGDSLDTADLADERAIVLLGKRDASGVLFPAVDPTQENTLRATQLATHQKPSQAYVLVHGNGSLITFHQLVHQIAECSECCDYAEHNDSHC